jgi:hypothetical protein
MLYLLFQPPISPNLGGIWVLGDTPKTPGKGTLSLCTPKLVNILVWLYAQRSVGDLGVKPSPDTG